MQNKYFTMDINIAYSIINMKLRDKYSSLEELCEDEDINMSELLKRLENENIVYSEEKNQLLNL